MKKVEEVCLEQECSHVLPLLQHLCWIVSFEIILPLEPGRDQRRSFTVKCTEISGRASLPWVRAKPDLEVTCLFIVKFQYIPKKQNFKGELQFPHAEYEKKKVGEQGLTRRHVIFPGDQFCQCWIFFFFLVHSSAEGWQECSVVARLPEIHCKSCLPQQVQAPASMRNMCFGVDRKP